MWLDWQGICTGLRLGHGISMGIRGMRLGDKAFFDLATSGFQCGGQFLGQFAAGLGHVGPAAAAALDQRRRRAYPSHRVQAAIDQIAAQAGD